jgi:hypothetical protein
MRRFESEHFPVEGAKPIVESHSLIFPSAVSREALEYVEQFIRYNPPMTELLRGYISSEYIDALVELQESNSSQGLNRAIKQISIDGSTSESVSGTFYKVDIQATKDNIEKLNELYYKADESETKTNIRTIQELIRINGRRDSINVYLPKCSRKIPHKL